MSRSTSAAVLVTPRIPLRLRLEAAATASQKLNLDGVQIGQLADTITFLPLGSELRVAAAHAIGAGTAAEFLLTLPTQIVSLATHSAADLAPADALQQTVALIDAADRLVVGDAVAASLQAIGLCALVESDTEAVAIHGQNGPQHVLAVFDGETLQIDVLGCEGTTCEPTVERLLSSLIERGFDVDELNGATHADPEGGRLIQAAARFANRANASLTTGALGTTRSNRKDRSRTSNNNARNHQENNNA
jgi:hypothetical protein